MSDRTDRTIKFGTTFSPEEIQKLKIAAIKAGMNINDYIVELVNQDMDKTE